MEFIRNKLLFRILEIKKTSRRIIKESIIKLKQLKKINYKYVKCK
jgi:hypothetical protein